MILFRCECGALHNIDDQFHGQIHPCDNCNQACVVPLESDPLLVYVYQKGHGETGFCYEKSTIREQIESGTLNLSKALAWNGIHWERLEKFAERGGLGDDFTLPKQEAVPLSKVSETAVQDAEKAAEENASNASEALSEDSSENDTVAKEEQSPVKKILRIVAIVIVVFGGYRFGFGPIISKVLKKPTQVIIYNGGDKTYKVTLGWRRLKTQVGQDGAAANLTLYTCWGDRQKITLTDEGGEKTSFTIPVPPGETVLVNADGGGRFLSYDPADIEKIDLASEIRNLTTQLKLCRDPAVAESILRELSGSATTIVGEPLADKYFFASEYNLSAFTVSKNESDKQKAKITQVPDAKVEFASGSFVFNTDKKEVTRYTIHLSDVKFDLAKSEIQISVPDGAEIEVVQESNRLSVRMSFKGKIRYKNRNVQGEWTYKAEKRRNRWSWTWNFDGKGKIGNVTKRIRFYESDKRVNGPVARKI